ncbi:steroid 17-alpha-hydroxylase/17,20 lyase-like [Saccostrea cucullata]|uniref:steroid 17-alpha-hydroxylase/17,20 lyase-like n=1 Tax=Saccostrea cuccullata TaxID=36930 RepID=UPI002ED27417
MNISANWQTILAGVCVGLLVYYVIKRMKHRLPPGPRCLPIIGNYQVYSSPDAYRKVFQMVDKYGPVISISFGPMNWIFLNNIDVVNEAFVKRQEDFAGRPQMTTGKMFTDGGKDIAFANYSPMWRLHRKVAAKALRHYLQGSLLQDMVQENMNKFMDKMAKEREAFVPRDYINLIVFHQLYTVCFGEMRPADDPEVKEFLKTYEDFVVDFGAGALEDLIPFLVHIYQTAKYKKLVRQKEKLFSFIKQKYKNHKETFDPSINRDFIDSLLIAKHEAETESADNDLEQFNDVYLIQTVADIFFAGTDTTKTIMDWFVCYLSGLPDVQAKCQEEIDNNIGSRQLTMKDRSKLEYVEACLCETMRLALAASVGVPHFTLSDTQVGGYDIPKGTVVLANFYALHRDPKHWENAETFDPTRFLDKNGTLTTKRESYLPFSAGRRVCLGEPVAKPELLLMCASLLQRFELRLPEGVKPNFDSVPLSFGLEIPHSYKIVVKDRNTS